MKIGREKVTKEAKNCSDHKLKILDVTRMKPAGVCKCMKVAVMGAACLLRCLLLVSSSTMSIIHIYIV